MCGSWADEFWRVRSVVRLLYDAGLPGCLWRPWAWNSFSVGFLSEPAGGDPRLRTGNAMS